MKKSFTIVECLIAILLLTIVMVGGMSFYFYSNGNVAFSAHRRIALEIANSQMEDIKNSGYANIINFVGSSDVNIGINGSGFDGHKDVGIINVNATSTTFYVRISWVEPDKNNIQQEVNLTTLMAS